MRIDISSDVDRIVKAFDQLATSQIPYGLARALTRTAQDAQADVQRLTPDVSRCAMRGCPQGYELSLPQRRCLSRR